MARRRQSAITLSQTRLREVVVYDPETGLFSPGPERRIKGGFGWSGGNGYLYVDVDKERFLLHRLAWFWVHGEWPSGEIDHINGNKVDNRIINLRVATVQQNRANRPTGRFARTSGRLKGAYRDKKAWAAQITVKGKSIYIGSFPTEAEAHAAYCKAAVEHFGEFANFGAGSPHRPDPVDG